MALTATDLFIVGRAAVNYKITADDLANYIFGGGKIGLGLNVTGNIVKVSIPVASTPPAAGALAAQAIDGSLYWDNNLTQLFIRYNNGGSPVWVAAAPSAGGGGGSFVVQTVPTAPGTATPNAVIPAGSTANRQTAPAVVAGEFRYNTTLSTMEFYDGGNWIPLAAVSATTTFGLGLNVTGQLVKAAVEEATSPPAAGALPAQAVVGSTYYDTNLGAMFIYYSNGGTPAWVMV